MSDSPGRNIPNARMRRFILAIQEVMGRSGLTTVLRQAGLQRYANNLPPNTGEAAIPAGEYAALMQSIENYYGRGARGTLNRIGHAAFRELLKNQPLRARLYPLAARFLPGNLRLRLALEWLARELAAPHGRVSVTAAGFRMILEDHESDTTCGRTREAEICWVTRGEIQEAVQWIMGAESQVTEVSCQAKGDRVCRFEIGDSL